MSNILNEAAQLAKKNREAATKKEVRWAEIQAGYEACDELIRQAMNTYPEDPNQQPYTDVEKLNEAKAMMAALRQLEVTEFGEREESPHFDKPYIPARPNPGSIDEALTDPQEWRELDTTTASPETAEQLRKTYGAEKGRE